MSRTQSNTWLALASLSLSALAMQAALADGVRSAEGAGKHRHAAASQSVKTAVQAPMTMAAQKANGSGVTLQYRVDGATQVGTAVTVVLQFDGVTDPQGASVRFTVDDGLTLRGSSTLSLQAGKSTSATVSIVSDREGLAFLNVFTIQNGRSSATSVPIQTGTVAPLMKSQGQIQVTPSGEAIISLPAK